MPSHVERWQNCFVLFHEYHFIPRPPCLLSRIMEVWLGVVKLKDAVGFKPVRHAIVWKG